MWLEGSKLNFSSPKKFIKHKKNLVCLYRSGCYTIRTHRRNPTTARREHFELLDVSPGPNRTSSDNLATPGSPRVSMLTPSLVRTLVQRDTQCSRTPVLKPSSNSSLPFAWITGPATDPSLWNQLETKVFECFLLAPCGGSNLNH